MLRQLALRIPRRRTTDADRMRAFLRSCGRLHLQPECHCPEVLREEAGGPYRHLYPTEPLVRFGPDIYRAHVRELLGRVERAEDLRPGTDAECLCAASGSDAAVAQALLAALSFRVYQRATLPRGVSIDVDRRNDALLDALRTRLRCDGRGK